MFGHVQQMLEQELADEHQREHQHDSAQVDENNGHILIAQLGAVLINQD